MAVGALDTRRDAARCRARLTSFETRKGHGVGPICGNHTTHVLVAIASRTAYQRVVGQSHKARE
jgi:hypothetical protein